MCKSDRQRRNGWGKRRAGAKEADAAEMSRQVEVHHGDVQRRRIERTGVGRREDWAAEKRRWPSPAAVPATRLDWTQGGCCPSLPLGDGAGGRREGSMGIGLPGCAARLTAVGGPTWKIRWAGR